MAKFAPWIAAGLLLLARTNSWSGAVTKDVEFRLTQDVGYGNEVCVLGSHPALGGNDSLKAIKLAWSAGNVWKGKIALPSEETLNYQYVRRSFSGANWTNPSQIVVLASNQSVQVPTHISPPWRGKTVFLLSPWSQANLYYRDVTRGGSWTTASMRVVGAGRSGVSGEKLFRLEGILDSGVEMEFVFNNGSSWLNAPAPPSGTATSNAPAVPAPYQGLSGPYNFRTSLDVFLVQDQQIFNYLPPSSLSAPRLVTWNVGSTVSNIPGRPITVYLPRGYTENTWKKYPVVYFHDGQNVFFPGAGFGTWDADRIATYEIGQGRMRECILVAVPNGNGYGSDRLFEYLPDGDTITNYGGLGLNFSGRASLYLKFILDNVTPTLDFNFRTLGDSANTMVAGSSMGGLVSDYFGFAKSDRFGAVGIFSPAYWAAPNYLSTRTMTLLPLRRYLYMGTAESSTGQSSSDVYWQGALSAYNSFLGAGHVSGRDLVFEGGPGASHNEAAWSKRMPSFYGMALNPWLEANPLMMQAYPPGAATITLTNMGSQAALRFFSFLGFQHILRSSQDLVNWSEAAVTPGGNYWDTIDVSDTATGSEKKFWSLQYRNP